MRIARSAGEIATRGGKVCLCIGFFDGVHLGHQQIIRQTVADARQYEAGSVVVTFDTHPSAVIRPEYAPRLVYSLEQRLSAIESCGAENLLLLHFDGPFSRQTGEEFIRGMVRGIGSVRSVCVGANFVFGHQRSGNVALLAALGKELGFIVHGLAAVALDGKPVSSTRIREAIKSGNLDFAGQMLGRAYSLAGPVVRGDALGRQLGFPTANIEVEGRVLPPFGVYAVHAEAGGRKLRGVLNIGRRPTLRSPDPQLRVECHLLDFDGDLYGAKLELTFVEKLRDEMRFGSLDELRSQIARDILQAQLRF